MKKTKLIRLAKVGKFISEFLIEIASTVVSAVAVIILYALYIPFGIGRALFNRSAIRGFYSDVFFAIDEISQRIHKREDESDSETNRNQTN